MADSIELPTEIDLYEADEHAWIERQIAALRDGAFDRLDRGNLIEFLNSMAARDRRELASRMTLLMQHMIKYIVQPERASRSWTLTILEQQREVRRLLAAIPTLRARADEVLREVFPDAQKAALVEIGGQIPLPPLSCFTLDEILSFDPEPEAPPVKPSPPPS
jgi:Domain of unknown function DUF29